MFNIKDRPFFFGKGMIVSVEAEFSTCVVKVTESNRGSGFELNNVQFTYAGFSTFFCNGIFYIPLVGDFVSVTEINGVYSIDKYLPYPFQENLLPEGIEPNTKEEEEYYKFFTKRATVGYKNNKTMVNFSAGRRKLKQGDSAMIGGRGESGVVVENKGDIEIFAGKLCSTKHVEEDRRIETVCDNYDLSTSASRKKHGINEMFEVAEGEPSFVIGEEFYFSRENDYTIPYFGVYHGKTYDDDIIRYAGVYYTPSREKAEDNMKSLHSSDCRNIKPLFSWDKINLPPIDYEDRALSLEINKKNGDVFSLTIGSRTMTDANYCHRTAGQMQLLAQEANLSGETKAVVSGGGVDLKLESGKMSVGQGSGRGPSLI